MKLRIDYSCNPRRLCLIKDGMLGEDVYIISLQLSEDQIADAEYLVKEIMGEPIVHPTGSVEEAIAILDGVDDDSVSDMRDCIERAKSCLEGD